MSTQTHVDIPRAQMEEVRRKDRNLFARILGIVGFMILMGGLGSTYSDYIATASRAQSAVQQQVVLLDLIANLLITGIVTTSVLLLAILSRLRR